MIRERKKITGPLVPPVTAEINNSAANKPNVAFNIFNLLLEVLSLTKSHG